MCGRHVERWGFTRPRSTGGGLRCSASGERSSCPARPRMAIQTTRFIEPRVVAFAFGHPGFGPKRISAELRRPKWDGIVLYATELHLDRSR
jgi:hypothetical protein